MESRRDSWARSATTRPARGGTQQVQWDFEPSSYTYADDVVLKRAVEVGGKSVAAQPSTTLE